GKQQFGGLSARQVRAKLRRCGLIQKTKRTDRGLSISAAPAPATECPAPSRRSPGARRKPAQYGLGYQARAAGFPAPEKDCARFPHSWASCRSGVQRGGNCVGKQNRIAARPE